MSKTTFQEILNITIHSFKKGDFVILDNYCNGLWEKVNGLSDEKYFKLIYPETEEIYKFELMEDNHFIEVHGFCNAFIEGYAVEVGYNFLNNSKNVQNIIKEYELYKIYKLRKQNNDLSTLNDVFKTAHENFNFLGIFQITCTSFTDYWSGEEENDFDIEFVGILDNDKILDTKFKNPVLE